MGLMILIVLGAVVGYGLISLASGQPMVSGMDRPNQFPDTNEPATYMDPESGVFDGEDHHGHWHHHHHDPGSSDPSAGQDSHGSHDHHSGGFDGGSYDGGSFDGGHHHSE